MLVFSISSGSGGLTHFLCAVDGETFAPLGMVEAIYLISVLISTGDFYFVHQQYHMDNHDIMIYDKKYIPHGK